MDTFISIIFVEQPKQWSLRGDPHLWENMKEYFSDKKLPYPVERFTDDFYNCFAEMCGQQLGVEEMTYVAHFDSGGMSRGKVSHEFWLNKGLPLLLKRLNDANNMHYSK